MCMRVELNQQKNGLPALCLPIDEVERGVEDLFVHGLHALLGQRAGVLDRLLADSAEARVFGRIVRVARLAPEHAARAEPGAERGVLRIVRMLRLILGIEMVEVAEELVEPVHRRQELVAVAEVVLAKLAGGVALRLEQFGERRIFLGKTFLRAGQSDFQQTGAERRLTGDERRASRRA